MLKRIVCGTLVDSPRVERAGARRQDRGLHAAAGRALAAHARDGGRPAGARHAHRPAHLRRSAPRRRPAERVRAARTSSSWSRSTGASGCSTSRSISTLLCCAARPPTRTATSRWSTRRSSARCCRWRRRRAAPAASSSCRSSASRCAARCRRSRSRSRACWSTSSWSIPTSGQTYYTALQPGLCRRAAGAAVGDRGAAVRCRARSSRAARRWSSFPARCAISGSGISTGIAAVAAEEDILDEVVLTNEQGLIGGAPASGSEAGAAATTRRWSTSPTSSTSTTAAGSISPSSRSRRSTGTAT